MRFTYLLSISPFLCLALSAPTSSPVATIDPKPTPSSVQYIYDFTAFIPAQDATGPEAIGNMSFFSVDPDTRNSVNHSSCTIQLSASNLCWYNSPSTGAASARRTTEEPLVAFSPPDGNASYACASGTFGNTFAFSFVRNGNGMNGTESYSVNLMHNVKDDGQVFIRSGSVDLAPLLMGPSGSFGLRDNLLYRLGSPALTELASGITITPGFPWQPADPYAVQNA